MSNLSKLILVGLIGWLSLPAPTLEAQGSEPARQPMLRIETGMHSGPIYRVAVDRAGKFLVTVSADKTARVWELAGERLLRVLRVPIEDGDAGKLYAVAISPDGNTIAVSGWTRFAAEKEHCIYLFDRESGRMIRRLGAFSNAVLNLTFSPDGALLAASLGGKNGVRVWKTQDWAEAGRDANYDGESYSGEFDVAGRLVTTCYDGFLRLYDRNLHLINIRTAPGGNRPYRATFSPDHLKIAVGYSDSTRVDVVDAVSLALLYSADTSGVRENVSLSSVAWSSDGNALYAGGTYTSGTGVFPIRRWTDAGRGSFVDTPAAANTIQDIATLPSRGVVYGASGPIWGILDPQQKQTSTVHAGPVADYRDEINSHFLTDTTGNALRFGYEQPGKSAALFKLSDRRLTVDAPVTNDLRPPRTEAPGLAITGWYNTYSVRLNEVELKLDRFERSRCLAISPSGDRFLLGTDYWVRLFMRSGEELWKVPSFGVAWNVNISGDGRHALAAYSDGTIRTYRLTDGKELLAFFPHADRKRWIVWSPSGFYDASPGAEDLIGWHVNNGRDQAADFFVVGQFRSTYYRPDVIAGVLQADDEARALALANAAAGRKQPEVGVGRMLPPVVEIISPVSGTSVSTKEVTVRFRLRTPSGEPVTNIKALVDGRPAGTAKDLVQQGTEGDTRELRVAIPQRDSELSIIAENQFAPGAPAVVRLKWAGASAVQPKPKLYLLAVGVSQYANDKYDLKFADKDARDFVTAMTAQKDRRYSDVVVYKGAAVTNDFARKDEIQRGLDWIKTRTTSDDVAMVFFSGHGLNDSKNNYYFCPTNIDLRSLADTGLPFSDIRIALAGVKGKVLFLVDSCHSGDALGMGWKPDVNFLINELQSARNGVLVISATTSSGLAYERPEWKNGAFTKALVEGVGGEAESFHTGRVTYASLVDYLTQRVSFLTDEKQIPSLSAQGGQSIVIAQIR